jgi:hypothetical protein
MRHRDTEMLVADEALLVDADGDEEVIVVEQEFLAWWLRLDL